MHRSIFEISSKPQWGARGEGWRRAGGGGATGWIKCRQHVVCGSLPSLYILRMRTRNCWWFVVAPLHVIWGPSSRVVTRVIMRRRIRGDVIRRAVILKLPDDHKTAPIGIYHLGAYYRRANPRGWKRRANEPEAPMIISRRHLAALTSNRDYRRTLSSIASAFPFFNTQTIPLMMPLHRLISSRGTGAIPRGARSPPRIFDGTILT